MNTKTKMQAIKMLTASVLNLGFIPAKTSIHMSCASAILPHELTKIVASIGRLGEYVDKWVNVFKVGGGQAAKMIRDDEIDILVELTGHTANNRCTR